MPARVCLVAVMMLSPLAAAAQTACGGQALGTVTVKAVRDARTLLTDDGRELRLAALEIPPAGARRCGSLEGRVLTLTAAAEARDRYGRIVAFATAPDTTRSVQETLLSEGAGAGFRPDRRQSLRRGAVNHRARGARGAPRPLGRSKFRPFARGRLPPVPG